MADDVRSLRIFVGGSDSATSLRGGYALGMNAGDVSIAGSSITLRPEKYIITQTRQNYAVDMWPAAAPLLPAAPPVARAAPSV
jgi:hypothetical protein